MSLELIYTSAPKGIKPGSSGFCTVAMTQGMPAQLIDRLEALSGYRQLFAPQDPQAGLNPAVCSHLRISVAGRNYHILSRVCASGLDYSQRANKFAYHVALDNGELPPAGPAWLLAMPGYMASRWDQSVRLLPPRGRPPNGPAEPAICHQWQQATGDAGWGGAMIDALKKNSRAMVTLIFRPGTDPLPLVAESLALLPPNERWATTFSTYFTKLPAGVDCRWRCVVEGSPEAKIAAGLVVDLSRSMGQPPPGEFVTAARTGQIRRAEPAPRGIQGEKPSDLQLAQLLGEPAAAAPSPASISAPSNAPDWLDNLQPGPPSIPSSPATSTFSPREFRRKETAKWPYLIAGVAVVLLIAGGAFVALQAWKPTGASQQTAKGAATIPQNTPSKPKQSRTLPQSMASNDPRSAVPDKKDTNAAREGGSVTADRKQKAAEHVADATASSETPDAGATEVAKSEAAKPCITNVQPYFPIRPSQLGQDLTDHPPEYVCEVVGAVPQLELIGKDINFPGGDAELQRQVKKRPSEPWTWVFAAGGLEIGSFILRNDGKLVYLPAASADDAGRRADYVSKLGNCILQVTAGGEAAHVQLRKPAPVVLVVPPGPLFSASGAVKPILAVPASNGPPPGTLAVKILRVDGMPKFKARPYNSIDVFYPPPVLDASENYSNEELQTARRPLHISAIVPPKDVTDQKWPVLVHVSVKVDEKEAELVHESPDPDGLVALSTQVAGSFTTAIGAEIESINRDKNRLDELRGSNNKTKEETKELEKLKSKGDFATQIRLWRLKKKNFEQLERLVKLATSLNQQSLHYQILLELGQGDSVVLLTTEVAKKVKPSLAGPNP